MDVEHRWYYMKYRFDVHHHYRDEAPPPQPMWQDNILRFHTPEANAWLLRRELQDMYAELSSAYMCEVV